MLTPPQELRTDIAAVTAALAKAQAETNAVRTALQRDAAALLHD
jgi:hypothetical protein